MHPHGEGSRLLGMGNSSVAFLTLLALASTGSLAQAVRTGQSAFVDAQQQVPGQRIHLTLKDLPAPAPDQDVDNGPHVAPRGNAVPKAPAGYSVQLYADGFEEPRLIRTAPNGDFFLADSSAGLVYVLRGVGADWRAQQKEVFASGLDHPFGINFYPAQNPKFVYVANTTSVVRFPYRDGDLHATGPAQTVVPDLPGYAKLRGGGHWTRDVVFSRDGSRMFVSVGSKSNVEDTDTHPDEFHRADVLEYTPQGKFVRIYASGLRNCVGEAVNPETGELWCSTNERDRLGNHLVPDYITHVQEGGFYGWPWFYMGGNWDPRLNGKHPELRDKVITPDVLVQPHMASLEMTFYAGSRFPDANGDAFAAEHGSWNRRNRAGYEVIKVPMLEVVRPANTRTS